MHSFPCSRRNVCNVSIPWADNILYPFPLLLLLLLLFILFMRKNVLLLLFILAAHHCDRTSFEIIAVRTIQTETIDPDYPDVEWGGGIYLINLGELLLNIHRVQSGPGKFHDPGDNLISAATFCGKLSRSGKGRSPGRFIKTENNTGRLSGTGT